MQHINLGVIVVVVVVVLGLIVFIIDRNKRDRKKLLPPEKVDDVTAELRMDQERKKDEP
ncbi:hypothetical protein QEG73_07635 [Chitinophagaceae bacterium 26-R-25]|nr:hypothetical protein [Chitinophagaceae bacterium 26-R-25]